tara:strand:- start:398 stop:1333 length:936 start_codon:yes stop_codon:yes gene_type:complete
MTNILLTGGAGYIGSVLTKYLLDKDYNVTIVDNHMYDQFSLGHLLPHKKLKVIVEDVRNKEIMTKLISDNDIIIPLAAYVGAPLCSKDPVGANSVNKDSIKFLLSKVSNQQIIIMPTTNSAYGDGQGNIYCDESTPLKPISKYAIDKVEVEKLLMEREKSISFRLATVFGVSPRMRLDLLVNDFVNRALKDKFIILFEGKFKRNYIHVSDVARSFIYALENEKKFSGEIFNIGLSDANLSKIELCEEIKKQIPEFYFKNAEVGKDPDQRNYIVSNKKIETFGFLPKINISEGIAELIKCLPCLSYKKHGNI